VTTDLKSNLAAAIVRLANEPALRVALGKRALEVGREYIAYEKVRRVFTRALSTT